MRRLLLGLVLFTPACGSDTTNDTENPPGDGDSDEATHSALDAYLEGQLETLGVPGLSAAIIKNGTVQWSGGYGLANVETGLPMTADTPIMLASISKTPTAVALMQVWEEQGFDLQSDVDDILGFSIDNPGAPNDPITIHQLLTHTSSIQDNWSVMDAYYVEGDSEIPVGTYLEAYLNSTGELYEASRNFSSDAPGTSYDYSNIGAATVGHLVEALTGQDFGAWCNSRIFDPLGMTHTGWFLADFDPDVVAMPYRYNQGSEEWVAYGHYGYPDYPDGQLRASAHDLAVFLATISNAGTYDGTRILEASTVESLLASQIPSIDPEQGLIWFGFDWLGSTWYGHDGGDWGINTDMMFRQEDGTGFVLLVNGELNNYIAFYDVEERLIQEAATY